MKIYEYHSRNKHPGRQLWIEHDQSRLRRRVNQNQTQVVFSRKKITQEGRVLVNLLNTDAVREKALAKKNLSSLGQEREITFASNGTMQTATIIMPINKSLLPKGMSVNDAKIAYYNPVSGDWEIQNNSQAQGDNITVMSRTFHLPPRRSFRRRQSDPMLRLPNPAKTNQVTIVHSWAERSTH